MDRKEHGQKAPGDPSTTDAQADIDENSALDAVLKRAMTIDVPELKMPELPDVETSKVVSLAERRRARAPVWLATAAAITMAAVFGVYTYNESTSYESLADQIIAHMDHEPYALVVTDVPVNAGRLERVVPSSVANLSPRNGLITYAESCEINGNSVPHLVVQGERGPVTIILLPDEKIEAAMPFQSDNVNGVLIPVGEGSIAIIGEESPESMERIKESFVDAVSWQT